MNRRPLPNPIRMRLYREIPACGFTLIELMIVVAIVAVLAMIALPAYQSSVRKSRRAEAVSALSAVQQAQERWRANNATYAANGVLTTAWPTGLGLTAATPNGYYAIAISGNTATAYTVTATAQGGQTADRASGVVCSPLTVTVANGSGVNTPAACWSR
jgi:type IV pilus assembly protein PilE